MIRRIQITGIHGDQDIDQELYPGLNILHAKNGTGKSTFLHVVANLFERDLERFCHLRFLKITVTLQDGGVVSLRQRMDGERPTVSVEINGTEYDTISRSKRIDLSLDQLLYEKLGGRPVYIPAFRSILEGSQDSNSNPSFRVSRENEELQEILTRERHLSRGSARVEYPGDRAVESVALKTVMCRGWFGDFVPVVRYPSLADVDRALSREIRQAYFAVSRTDQRILSNIFLRVFDAIVKEEASPLVIDTSALVNQLVTELGALNQASVSGSELYAQLEQRLRQQADEGLPDEARIKVILSIYDDALAERSNAERDAFKNIQRFLESVNTFLTGKSIEFRSELIDRPHASET